MAVLPNSIPETISFSREHVDLWTGQEAAIGLVAADTTGLNTTTTDAESALTDQAVAQTAAKSATTALHGKYQLMRDDISLLIKKIKAFADAQADPSEVYARAGIPMPATPTPAGPPTDATNVVGTINNAGWVELRWTGTLANSQFFSVWRQLQGETTYTQLGAISAKTFVDNLVPTGKAWANYVIRAHRGTQVSAGTEPIAVLFGVQELAA